MNSDVTMCLSRGLCFCLHRVRAPVFLYALSLLHKNEYIGDIMVPCTEEICFVLEHYFTPKSFDIKSCFRWTLGMSGHHTSTAIKHVNHFHTMHTTDLKKCSGSPRTVCTKEMKVEVKERKTENLRLFFCELITAVSLSQASTDHLLHEMKHYPYHF